MKSLVLLVLLSFSLGMGISDFEKFQSGGKNNNNEEKAKEFLQEYNEKVLKLLNAEALAHWKYTTNLNKENLEAHIAAGLAVTQFTAAAFETGSHFDTTNFSTDTTRQLSKVGKKSLSDEEMKNLTSIISQMGQIYGEGKVCRNSTEGVEECLRLGSLFAILGDSRNTSELLWAWEGWRANVGRKIKPLYFQYVTLKNKLARANGYKDYGDEMLKMYETSSFETDIRNLYQEMKPLYMELHAYIRRKLYDIYGPDVVDINGTIPQHLLGHMFGRFWINIYSLGVPYPKAPNLDMTDTMIAQNYTVRKMYEKADEFYKSMGLFPLPKSFYNLSQFERPEDDHPVLCHPAAIDLLDGKDFRIRICISVVDYFNFLTIHHELGHIQYYMQYANQPAVYRDGANDGFHEAIGELMSMCVSTPKHLYNIGLLDRLLQDDETTINFLFQKALTSVSTLPFHYIQDLWRWRAFRGDYPDETTWNDEFWKLSEELVGVHPPIPRMSEDLDCPSIVHVAQDQDMIRYFVRTILQFQFAESLCRVAGQGEPLYECDFGGSTAAGEKLVSMLRLGNSKPWPEALETLTGSRTMDAAPMRKYFEPLEKWLKQTNKANGDTPGWTVKGLYKTKTGS